MKNLALKLTFLTGAALLSFNSFAQNVAIPDPIFEQHLIDKHYDTVLDGYVNKQNIQNVFGLTLDNLGINNLSGIQHFTSLQWIYFRNNNLTTVNFGQNSLLKKIIGDDNNLTSITIPNNNKLELIQLNDNNLVSLNVSGQLKLLRLGLMNNNMNTINVQNNIKLTELNVGGNNLTSLNVASNVLLTNLLFDRNNISSVNISTLPALKLLSAYDNNLQSINVSQNSDIDYVLLQNNDITSLDFSSNTKIKMLNVSNNNLDDLNIKNGYNSILTTFSALTNPDLTCILVDNANYSPSTWFYSSQVGLSESPCGFGKPYAYPNPFSSTVSIGPENNGITSYQIFNSSGEQVGTGILENNQITPSNLPNGTYILILFRNGVAVKTLTIVKNGRFAPIGGYVPIYGGLVKPKK